MYSTTETPFITGAGKSAIYVGLAALIPAILIGYSALVDPLMNFGLAEASEFGGVQIGGEEKSKTLTRLVIPGLFAITIALAIGSRPSISRRLALLLVPPVLFLAMAATSSLWSRDPSGTFTQSVYQCILLFTLVLAVSISANPERVLKAILLMFALVVAVNVVFALSLPAGPIGHQGIYSHKNTLGAVASLACLFALFSSPSPRLLWKVVSLFTLAGGVFLVVVSDSKTSLGLLFLAPLFAVAVYTLSRTLRCGPAFALLLVCMLLFFGYHTSSALFDFDFEDFLYATVGDPTFTGRTGIWDFASDHIAEAPIAGHGYRAFWSLGLASPKHASEIEFNRTIGSAHSGYYDVLIDLGIIGLGLMIAYVALSIARAFEFRIRPKRQSLLYLSVVLFTLGRNAMESVILWSTFFDNLSFMLVGILACYPVMRLQGSRIVLQAPRRIEARRRAQFSRW